MSSKLRFWDNIDDNYLISDDGFIMNIKTNKILAGSMHKNGYHNVTLHGKHYLVHRLVAEAFCSKKKNCDIVNHIDGNRLNNYYTNLEWTTRKGNAIHAYSKLHPHRKGIRIRVKRGDELIGIYDSYIEAGKVLKISSSSICDLVKKQKASKHGYTFEKLNDISQSFENEDFTSYKPIKNWPEYLISPKGKIFSVRTKKIISQYENCSYYWVTLYRGKYIRGFSVHRLVAETFIGSPDKKDFVVNHKDGNCKNNNVNNLEWMSQRDNVRHAYKNNLVPIKMNEIEQIDLETKKVIKIFENPHRAASALGIIYNGRVRPDNIVKVCKGTRNKAYGYTWRYKLNN